MLFGIMSTQTDSVLSLWTVDAINKSISSQTVGHLSRPAAGPRDGAVPRVRACRPGPQPLHREVSSAWPRSGEDQGHHVADSLRGGFSPQPQDRPQVTGPTVTIGW